jgi:hypothetical protein
MRISYRVTSIAVVLVVVGMFIAPESLMVRPPAPTRALGEGIISFDPCSMWEQIGWLIRLAALVWIVTFLPLFLRGLWNRTLPRMVAAISLIAFGLSLRNQVWQVEHCESNVGIGMFAAWVIAVGLLCIHHVLQRPVRA